MLSGESSSKIRFVSLLIGICIIFLASCPTLILAESSEVGLIKVDGPIVPVTANFIDRCIKQAEANKLPALIIQLDTPGGLLNTTELIVQCILNANIPVIVYVAPSGASAASAGTFITLAGSISAMSPGTTIGAAHPVSLGEPMGEDVSKKVTEHSAAWIQSIAEKRGKNIDAAKLTVTDSKSYTAAEALEIKLIDVIADDVSDLLLKVDGMTLYLADNRSVILNTSGASIREYKMSSLEEFIKAISDPNIAYLLLSLGTIGLFVEISNPGLIFPGVIGGICLFTSLYSLGVLNAYWAGLILIILALGLFIAEIFTPTFGILTGSGAVSFIAGSMLLFINNPPSLQVSPWLIAAVTLVFCALVIFMIFAVVRGQIRKKTTGVEGLIGKVAVVKNKLNPNGMVLVDGELWQAVLKNGIAEKDEEVIIKDIQGLKLIVEKSDSEKGVTDG